MNINVAKTTEEMGELAARKVAELLNSAILRRGSASLILSTGASQFVFYEKIMQEDVDWSKVEMFHLDEYVNLPGNHPASFRKYLKERFVKKNSLKAVYYVNGEGNIDENIHELNDVLAKRQIDVGVIGIGENAHIAFNDPPADFDTTEPYKIVTLDERCRLQQVREGWFEKLEDVPARAITMTVQQIMKCRTIVSIVPHAEKAEAIMHGLTESVNKGTPATILKTHADWYLFLDQDSASAAFPL